MSEKLIEGDVQCPKCSTRQRVITKDSGEFAFFRTETIRCLNPNCDHTWELALPGPFLRAEPA